MRHLFVCVVMVCLLSAFGIAKAATYSDNFSDNTPDPILWSYTDDGNPNTSLYENNGNLNFTANNTNNTDEYYLSNWSFETNGNILTRMDFNNSYTGTGKGGISLGLYPFTMGPPYYLASMGVDYNSAAASTKTIWMSVATLGGASIWQQEFDRTVDSGWFNIYYNASANTLEFTAYDQVNTQIAYGVFNNFTGTFTDPMRAYIRGYTGTSGISNAVEGNIYADNFGITSDPIPEPLTGGLFIFGSALLGLMGRNRKQLDKSR